MASSKGLKRRWVHLILLVSIGQLCLLPTTTLAGEAPRTAGYDDDDLWDLTYGNLDFADGNKRPRNDFVDDKPDGEDLEGRFGGDAGRVRAKSASRSIFWRISHLGEMWEAMRASKYDNYGNSGYGNLWTDGGFSADGRGGDSGNGNSSASDHPARSFTECLYKSVNTSFHLALDEEAKAHEGHWKVAKQLFFPIMVLILGFAIKFCISKNDGASCLPFTVLLMFAGIILVFLKKNVSLLLLRPSTPPMDEHSQFRSPKQHRRTQIPPNLPTNPPIRISFRH